MLSLSFREDTHQYFVGVQGEQSVEIPSQSKILDAAGFVTPYPQGDYRERGTAVHRATLLHDQGRLGRVDTRIEGYIRGYLKFLFDFPEAKGSWDSSEEPRYHQTLMYAGTADRVRKKRKKLVLDIKTGTPPEKRLRLQLAGYVMLHFEPGEWGDVLRWGLQLFPDGDYKLRVCTNLTDYAVWEGIVRRYHWERS